MKKRPDKTTKTIQEILYRPVWAISYLTGWRPITRLFSAEQIVSNIPSDRFNYALERRAYRQAKRLIEEGNNLDHKSYEIYKLIALKYDWPYKRRLDQ